MKSHLPRWPTGSPDPAVNIIATGVLVILGILALATSLVLLVPIAISFGVIGIIRWHYNRPPPYASPALLDAVARRSIEANFPDTDTFVKSYVHRLIDGWSLLPVWPVFARMAEIAGEIYEQEQLSNPLPPLATSDPIELARRADELSRHMRKIADAPKTLAIMTDVLTQSLAGLRDHLPGTALQSRQDLQGAADGAPAPLTVPLLDAAADIPQAVEDVALPYFADAVRGLDLFRGLKAQLDRNTRAASENSKGVVRPPEYKGTAREIVDAYLHDTPMQGLFDCQLPFVLPDEARFAGHWILSPPGRGKTTLLHAMVMDDIEKRGACLILMDSKGDLIEPIRGLRNIQDRLIVIDPDPQNPVAINPLDIARADLAQSVDLLEYLFGSLLEFKMTAMQTTLFRSVLRALVTGFPNPTLDTFRDLLTNGYEKYAAYIAELPPDLQDFFRNDFNERNYADRRREVLQRLRLLLDNETMRSMLTATNTRFRIGEAMDTGKIVIINNSKARLGDQGAEFFGRFFIAQVLAAAQQRSTRQPDQKPPVYFYIDECQNVIARDEKIPTILDECRSQNIALVMAHQRTKQINSENVLDALSNCAIRFANSDEEARFLAPRLRTSPEFLQSFTRGKFAAFVRDVTKQAVAVSVNRVSLADRPGISPEEARNLRERMRQEYGILAKADTSPIQQPEPRVDAVRRDPPRPAATRRDSPADTEGAADWH
jgi:hypothetical protein